MNLLQPEEKKNSSVEEKVRRLKNSVILLSRDALKDPNFESTIVLLCVHNSEGSYGLVLNRPSHMPLSEIFDGFSGIGMCREIFIGGPVRQEELQILHFTDSPMENAFKVSENLYLGGKWDDFSGMIESDPKKVKIFLGYSGWGAGQLQAEVRLGAWDVYEVNLKKLFSQLHELLSMSFSEIVTFLEGIRKI